MLSLKPLALAALLLSMLAVVATLPPPERQYNILMLLPVSSKSHRNVFMPLATALAQRGHKVTMLSNHPSPDTNPNITHLHHGLPYVTEDEQNMFEIRNDLSQLFDMFQQILPKIAREIYQIPIIKELYSRRTDFDITLIDHFFNELTYPFVHERTFITVATPGLEVMHSAVLGNIQNPAYVSTNVKKFQPPLSMTERLRNLLMTLQFPLLWRHLLVVPKIQDQISKIFPDLPPLLEIERNQSLTLLNSHFSLSTALPLLPAQVEVGGMHCREGGPLPKDIEDFISGKEPVIYFSLGSVVKGTTMPAHHQHHLLAAFSKLPYKVLWKFEDERKDLPNNVMIKKWMPQQDILAHPNVKLFISHCGLLSVQEAMYHGKPVLGLPVFADQPKNAEELEIKGLGKMITWEQLTEQLLLETIQELMTNPSYARQVAAVSRIYKDQPQHPVDRAVFWTEYVVRHSGAVHLRSPERDLSWVQVLHLDILLLFHVIIFLLIWTIKKLVRLCLRTVKPAGRSNKKKKD